MASIATKPSPSSSPLIKKGPDKLLLERDNPRRDGMVKMDGEIWPWRFMLERLREMMVWVCGVQVIPTQLQKEVLVVQLLANRLCSALVIWFLKSNRANSSETAEFSSAKKSSARKRKKGIICSSM